MKGLTLFLLLALGAGSDLRAQGTVNFQNFTYNPVYLYPDQLVPVGNTFLAELMFAPDGTSLVDFDSVAIRMGAPASFVPVPGVFVGGTRTVPVAPAGGFAVFQVRVWESAYGSSYNEVLASGNPNARAGKSDIFRNDTGNNTISPPDTPRRLDGLTSFTVAPLWHNPPAVPEPSTYALAVLAFAFGLIRKKRSTPIE